MPAAIPIAALVVSAYAAYSSHKAAADSLDYQKETAAKAQADAEASKPQASKATSASDTASAMSGTGQSGGAPGVAQTFLTGASGVDSSTLDLGKSTLLGGA